MNTSDSKWLNYHSHVRSKSVNLIHIWVMCHWSNHLVNSNTWTIVRSSNSLFLPETSTQSSATELVGKWLELPLLTCCNYFEEGMVGLKIEFRRTKNQILRGNLSSNSSWLDGKCILNEWVVLTAGICSKFAHIYWNCQ